MTELPRVRPIPEIPKWVKEKIEEHSSSHTSEEDPEIPESPEEDPRYKFWLKYLEKRYG